MASTYAIELRLAGRPVVVVGGGRVATRRVVGLLEAGAAVRVVSPQFTDELTARNDITRQLCAYDPDCLAGAVLVFACTDDHAVNAAVAADAHRLGLFCNVADDPPASDFHVPAVLRRGELTIGVSTGGAGPTLAAAVRDRVASQIGPEWGILTEELARARDILKQRVGDPDLRRQILETLCTDCSIKLLALRDREAWRKWFERVTESRLRGVPADLESA